jgi:hypothetical protein
VHPSAFERVRGRLGTFVPSSSGPIWEVSGMASGDGCSRPSRRLGGMTASW